MNTDLEFLPPRFSEKGGAHRIIKHSDKHGAGSVSIVVNAGRGPVEEGHRVAKGVMKELQVVVKESSGWSAEDNKAFILNSQREEEEEEDGEEVAEDWEAEAEEDGDWETGLMSDGTSLKETNELDSWTEDDVRNALRHPNQDFNSASTLAQF